MLVVALVCSPAQVLGARYSAAEELFFAGQYNECLETARKEFESGVRHEPWSRLLIRCQLTTGQYADALETYQQAIKRFPYSVHLRMLGYDAHRFNDDPDQAQQQLEAVMSQIRRSPWRYSSRENQVALGRYFYTRGEDAKEILELFYDRVRKADPKFLDAYVASAELALDKHDYKLAAELLEEAQKLDSKDPQLPYLAARAWADSEPEKASSALVQALKLNPRHVPSLLLKINNLIDAERYDDAEKLLAAVLEVNDSLPEAWAYRAVIAHLQGGFETEQQHRRQALKPWQSNPAVDHLIGKKLSQKYRFAEGARSQRLALAMDANFLPAKFQLAQDLLRLGDEGDGWELADEAFSADEYNIVAHNLVTLRDRLQEFSTLYGDGLIVRMDAREARIYGEAVLRLLAEARETLCGKYDAELELPVIVEIFPQQQDFAIRTFGLPGGAGFLGVCFGRVITANSPASQGQNPSNWQSVLWHEFCHVVTLHKTNNRMPRWLSEGISVYEERLKDATWGQAMTPQYRAMVLGSELTPASELSGAFLSPQSPLHLQFAYYESSLVVEFFVEKFGLGALKELLRDLGVGMPINEALPRYVGPLEKFDSDFAEFARQRARELGENADWDDKSLPEQAGVDELREWTLENPDNYWALRRLARALVETQQYDEAGEVLDRLHELYPDDPTPGSALHLRARMARERGDVELERETLQKLASRDSDAIDVFARLAELCVQAEDWPATLESARRILAVNPLLPVGHEMLALAGESLEQYEDVADSLIALGEMEPLDPAGLHFRIAVALDKLGERNRAKRHALMALEEAPRYRDAQQLLLTLVDADGNGPSEATSQSDPPAEPGEASQP